MPEIEYKEEQGGFSVWFYKDIYNEENLRKMGLNERQIKAVLYAREKGYITLSSFKKLIERTVSEKILYRDLQDMTNRGILRGIGKKKGRRYELL